ncbi:MAG: M23 family metallopeptidase [Elusimicrobiota bacterium]|jgi:lysostaphin
MRAVLPLLLASAACAWEPALVPGAVAPGEVLAVSLEPGADPARNLLRLDGRILPFRRAADGGVRVLVGFSAKAAPGPRVLEVVRRGFFFDGERKVPFEVLPATFSVRRLRMEASRAALPTSPVARGALASIRAALAGESPEQLWAGPWRPPLADPRLTAGYGNSRTVNGREWSWHKGVDYGAPAGTPVLAPAAGRVVLAERYPVQGGVVVVDHGQGVLSALLHMKSVEAKVGQNVEPGARVGRVGTAGFSTGPHLHWGVYVHGEPVDPLPWLRRSY